MQLLVAAPGLASLTGGAWPLGRRLASRQRCRPGPCAVQLWVPAGGAHLAVGAGLGAIHVCHHAGGGKGGAGDEAPDAAAGVDGNGVQGVINLQAGGRAARRACTVRTVTVRCRCKSGAASNDSHCAPTISERSDHRHPGLASVPCAAGAGHCPTHLPPNSTLYPPHAPAPPAWRQLSAHLEEVEVDLGGDEVDQAANGANDEGSPALDESAGACRHGQGWAGAVSSGGRGTIQGTGAPC